VGAIFVSFVCRGLGVTVGNLIAVATDLESTAAGSKSAMVVGDCWAIPTGTAIDLSTAN